MSRRWGIASVTLLAACGWYDDGRPCEEGQTSCEGDRVRTCVPDAKKGTNSDGRPFTTWQRAQTCNDDPIDGRLTCGYVAGQAQCVAQAEDGSPVTDAASAAEAKEAQWLRLDVELGDDDTYALTATETHFLKGRPARAATGAIAAVSYDGDEAIDATLVPLLEAGTRSVWVRSAKATRVALLDSDGTVLAEREVGDVGVASDALVAVSRQALNAELPPTLRLATNPDLDLPPELSWRFVEKVEPSAAALELVGEALGTLPMQAVSALTAVAFVASDDDSDPDPAASVDITTSTRTALDGNTLWVNVTPTLLALYAQSASERIAVQHEIVRRAGEAYAALAAGITKVVMFDRQPKLPRDFPPEIAALLEKDILPLLSYNETFEQAWMSLHGLGVEVKIAGPYRKLGSGELSDFDAVTQGFASAYGSQSGALDFAEYLAHASVPQGWTYGPCAEIRATPLSDLAPRLMVPIAKLHVLWALGVLSREGLEACVGDLSVAMEREAIALHTATGEFIELHEEVGGARTLYLHAETHVSGFAQKGDVHGAFDLMYKSGLPSILRLNAVQNARAQDSAVTLALTDDLDYVTSPAIGGLFLPTLVTQERIEGRALMVKVQESIFGTKVFPLVTVRIDKPTWPEVQGYDDE